MECQHASTLMSQRLDGQLSENQESGLDEHLATCVCCRDEWEELQALDMLFAEPLVIPAPVQFKGMVMERIRRREQAKRAVTGGIVLMLGVVAIVGLLLAPLLVHTLNIQGVLPVLLAGGPTTASHVINYLESLGRAAVVLVEQLAGPLCTIAAAFLTAALVLNCALIGVLRRVYVKR